MNYMIPDMAPALGATIGSAVGRGIATDDLATQLIATGLLGSAGTLAGHHLTRGMNAPAIGEVPFKLARNMAPGLGGAAGAVLGANLTDGNNWGMVAGALPGIALGAYLKRRGL